jgi:hypothetical protein
MACCCVAVTVVGWLELTPAILLLYRKFEASRGSSYVKGDQDNDFQPGSDLNWSLARSG